MKTIGDGLSFKLQLLVNLKEVSTCKKRCRDELFKKYLDKRPAELMTTGPLKLNVIDQL